MGETSKNRLSARLICSSASRFEAEGGTLPPMNVKVRSITLILVHLPMQSGSCPPRPTLRITSTSSSVASHHAAGMAPVAPVLNPEST